LWVRVRVPQPRRRDISIRYSVVGFPNSLVAADINGDSKTDLATVGDTEDVSVFLNEATPSFSLDLNHNGIPDECETQFRRGDPNSSGTTDISDGIAIFGFLFLGNPATLSCKESADANNDGTIDISDGISLLNWLFIGGRQRRPGQLVCLVVSIPILPGRRATWGADRTITAIASRESSSFLR
jgi:hypothetical protein